MKYFVTGATGFIGGYLAQRLIRDGHEVVALVRTPAKAQALADTGVIIAQGDITDKASMREPMTGVDGVFHVAAWYKVGMKDSSMAQTINVEGTRNVLELMKELGVPKGVYTSTVAVFSDTKGELKDEKYKFNGEHLSEYDRTKWEAHYRVAQPMMDAGLPLVIVQPGAVYGKGDQSELGNTTAQYLQRKLPVIPQGMAVCWARVEDVVEGHILAMEKGEVGESYIIAGPPHTLVEYFELAEQITGIPAPRLKAPAAMLKASAALMGVIGNLVEVPATYTAEGLRVSAGVTYLGDNSKAKRELGYNPRSLEAGLPEILAYEMERLGIRSEAK
ncbi:MAG: NAD-dependent epimerase/dehydratase family protein [Anaerolineaceae bacterium]|nr:NAD-dependent epimerase/dehydratase family protein [Anaerolineaceae bacterium]